MANKNNKNDKPNSENRSEEKLANFSIIKKPLFRKIILFGAGGLLILGLAIFLFEFSYRDKIFPKTFIGGINLGGKTKAQAEQILANETSKTQKNQIDLKYQDKSWTIDTTSIELEIIPKDSSELAWRIGRTGGLGAIIKEQLRAVFSANRHLAVFNYNQGQLDKEILRVADEIDISEQDASLKIENQKAIVVPEKSGQFLDFVKTQEDILTILGSFATSTRINLSVNEIKPKVNSINTENAAILAEKIIGNSLKLHSSKKDYILSSSDIASFLDFVAVQEDQSSTGKIDLKKAGTDSENSSPSWTLEVLPSQDKISAYLSTISGEINQEPQNAKFAVTNGQVTTFQTSQTGYQLNSDKAKALISTAILNNQALVKLPVKTIKPEITSNSATTMGLKELVSEGRTSWWGSPPNRIHNLSLGAQKISGTIVRPGEEFSTVHTIGEIGPSTGFLPELVIKNSTQVVPDYGGGLCQVSTTLFRAVLNAGLKITARTAHSFRVSYYEPPVGMDATIYDPAPDFKFINNMKTPILIWGIAGNNSLAFQIYGTKDGRKIDISSPYLSNYTDPPAPVYTESSTMEPGTIRQVERALRGVTASFHYQVTSKTGEVLEKDTFTSKYVPLSDSYLVGPGYQIPPAG